MSFAEDGCLRRAELLGIGMSDIPSWDAILDARAAGTKFTVEVCGKRGKRRYVSFSPQQTERARDLTSRLKMYTTRG
jgi:integrase